MKNNVMKVLDKEQMVHLIHREIDYENTWYMERKEDGALLGMIAAERTAFVSMCARDVFCVLSRSNMQQGYMKEALQAVLHELFTKKIWKL